MKHFKEFFKEDLVEVITMQFSTSLRNQLNRLLGDQPILQKLDENIFVNTSLTNEPFVKNGYVLIPFDGTV